MKKIISFSAPVSKEFTLTKKDFREVDGGYEVDQVIFSTAFNRNGYYFQVSKLMAYADKLSKLGTNFNHDLSLTNNQYIPASQAGYTKIWAEWLNGELEIRGTFKFSDQRVIDVMDQINAPSIELFVDEDTAIVSDKGEYYEDFEWVGTAQLLGILAGSGDARNISEFREFDINLNPITTMTEEQTKKLLDEQKEELTKTFEAQLDAIKKEFSVVAQSASASAGVYEWTDEEGNTYKETYESMYKSIRELVEKGEGSSDNKMASFLKANGFEVKKFHTVEANEPADQGEGDDVGTEGVEGEGEADKPNPELEEAGKQVEQALESDKAQKAKVFSGLKGSESQLDLNDAKGDVTEKNDANALPTFYSKLLTK